MCLRYLWVVLLLGAAMASAAIHHVPADYATIQAAIDASALHDTVLVSAGTYYENLSFHGHSIVLASEYLLNHDLNAVSSTIINGSQPAHADTGSVVRIISGEDSTTALIGFTITGGTGTPLRDQQSGSWYVEAGGVMTDGTSPTISHNLIVGNTASRTGTGITSAGGGGIRVGFGQPQILNNVIMSNTGRYYGGGVVVNFARATLRNNVIIGNNGGQTYGGGGLWIYGSAAPGSEVTNNTIVGNNSNLNGGGVFVWSTQANLRNNIIWSNHARTTGPQLERSGAFGVVEYSDIQTGISGTGNINIYPQFADTNLTLLPGSPCINAGNDSSIYNDPDGSRNDMGAYGGPGATPLPLFSVPAIQLSSSELNFGTATPGTPISRDLIIFNVSAGGLRIDSTRLGGTSGGTVSVTHVPAHVSPFMQDTLHVVWSPTEVAAMSDTLFIYTNDPAHGSPARVALIGNGAEGVLPQNPSGVPAYFRLGQNYPNPFNPSTQIQFDLPVNAQVRLDVFDVLGTRVTELLNGPLPAGTHNITWNASSEPNGIYFCRLTTEHFSATKKMVLVK